MNLCFGCKKVFDCPAKDPRIKRCEFFEELVEDKICEDCHYYNACRFNNTIMNPNKCNFYTKTDRDDNFYIN